MSNLFLIAHKVRGEPAFDIAKQMDCPECMDNGGCNYGCVECDQKGYWWIIPTSGHRAYPYWERPVMAILDRAEFGIRWGEPLLEMPFGLPDHYPTRHSSSSSLDISTLLAPAVKVKIERRF